MGRDYPDWGANYRSAFFFLLEDMGELAVRLGSIVSYDRRGNVLWMDGFDHGLGLWSVDQDEEGSDVTLDAGIVETGAFSAKLLTVAASPANVSISRKFEVFASEKLGLAISFRVVASVDRFLLKMNYQAATINYEFQVRYDAVNDNLDVYTEPDTWITIDDDLPDLLDGAFFSHLKMVVNLDTRKYERVMFSDQVYDVSAYEPNQIASVGAPYFGVGLELLSDTGLIGTVYLDNVIVTVVEP